MISPCKNEACSLGRVISISFFKGTTLHRFDQPSTGLHYFDILQLIKVFQSLVDHGDTLLFIEHNSTLIESADQVITLGPGSRESGGEVMD